MFDCSADPWRLRSRAAQPRRAFRRPATAASGPGSRAPRTQPPAPLSPTLSPLPRDARAQLTPSQQIMKLAGDVRLPPKQCFEAPASRRVSAASHLILDLEHRILITTMTPPAPATGCHHSSRQQANPERSPPRWFACPAREHRRSRYEHHLSQISPPISQDFKTILSRVTIPLKSPHFNTPRLEPEVPFNLPVDFAADRLIVQGGVLTGCE